nr:hypothetical protein [Tanacetum cinerariifolium]
MHKAFPLPVIEFLQPEEVPTASEESYRCQKKREATTMKIALLLKSRRNCQSKSNDSYAKLEKLMQEEQWAYLSTHPSKRLHSFCFDDDDKDYTSAITPDEPVLSTEEPDHSLSMGDEHLDTIPATESDEFIKYGVEDLIPIP